MEIPVPVTELCRYRGRGDLLFVKTGLTTTMHRIRIDERSRVICDGKLTSFGQTFMTIRTDVLGESFSLLHAMNQILVPPFYNIVGCYCIFNTLTPESQSNYYVDVSVYGADIVSVPDAIIKQCHLSKATGRICFIRWNESMDELLDPLTQADYREIRLRTRDGVPEQAAHYLLSADTDKFLRHLHGVARVRKDNKKELRSILDSVV